MKRLNTDQKNYIRDMAFAIIFAIICIIIYFAKMPEHAIQDYADSINGVSPYCFKTEQLLSEHFEKHRDEFTYQTMQEYEQGAVAVIENPNALHKTELEDGDDVYYLEETNEFVIVSPDSYIRTYFKPEDGIDYFQRQ